MTTEKSENAENIPADEITPPQADASATLQVPKRRVWYTYLNEDWLATLFGLLLVILLVVGLLHAIP